MNIFHIGNLKYKSGDIVVPGDVMRDLKLNSMIDAYKLLEVSKKENKLDTIYIYECDGCDEVFFYETINSLPETCENCDCKDLVVKETVVGYTVL